MVGGVYLVELTRGNRACQVHNGARENQDIACSYFFSDLKSVNLNSLH